MAIKPVTAMSDSKEEKFDYEEWKKSNVAPRKPANHKDAQDLYDAQKRVNEKREVSAPGEIKDYEAWQQAVKDEYPDVASKLKFKGRIENGKDTVSAEVPGEDRSYGVWDSDNDVGHVLGASVRALSSLIETSAPGEERKYVVYYFDGRMHKKKSPSFMFGKEALDFMKDIARTIKQPKNYPLAGTQTPEGYEWFTMPQLKAIHASSAIESRIKGDDEYAWMRFTGKPLEVTNDKGRTLRLATGDKYGARKSSSGKQIRLVTEKDGLTKVFTCDSDLAAYLGKNSKAV